MPHVVLGSPPCQDTADIGKHVPQEACADGKGNFLGPGGWVSTIN